MNEEIKKIYEDAIDIIIDEGYDARIMDDYIGKFRVHETIGIVTDAPGTIVGAAIATAAENKGLEWYHAIPKCYDSMGFEKMIYYI